LETLKLISNPAIMDERQAEWLVMSRALKVYKTIIF
jgi:hypothetical protein